MPPKLYNKKIANEIRVIKPPYPGLRMDIVEHPGMLSIRFYEENLNKFNDMQHISIMEYAHMIKNIIESHKIPCDLEAIRHDQQ